MPSILQHFGVCSTWIIRELMWRISHEYGQKRKSCRKRAVCRTLFLQELCSQSSLSYTFSSTCLAPRPNLGGSLTAWEEEANGKFIGLGREREKVAHGHNGRGLWLHLSRCKSLSTEGGVVWLFHLTSDLGWNPSPSIHRLWIVTQCPWAQGCTVATLQRYWDDWHVPADVGAASKRPTWTRASASQRKEITETVNAVLLLLGRQRVWVSSEMLEGEQTSRTRAETEELGSGSIHRGWIRGL